MIKGYKLRKVQTQKDMNKRATKQRGDNSMGAVSVLKKALKMFGAFENFMKYRTEKINQGSRKPFGLETGVAAGKHLAKALMFQGASVRNAMPQVQMEFEENSRYNPHVNEWLVRKDRGEAV